MHSLKSLIRSYDEALPAALCDQLIQLFEARTDLQERNGQGIRAGLEDSAWTELDLARCADAALGKFLAQQVRAMSQRYSAENNFTLPLSPAQKFDRWIIKRYRPGGSERFQPHYDALGPVCNRYLVLLWYLNTVQDGGATEFVDLDISITARRGRLLMFPPYWMFQHAGRPPLSGDKYILSTYLLY